MCPICIAVAGLFAAVFHPRRRRGRERDAHEAARWRLNAGLVTEDR
jgi:hypothetical protein